MKLSQDTIKGFADELGRLNAEKAAIDDRISEIRSRLTLAGVNAGEGSEYAFKFVRFTRETPNWKSIAQRLGPSRQLVTAHTVGRAITRLDISALY